MKTGLIRLVVAGMMITGVCAAVAQPAAGAAAAPKHPHVALWKGVLSAPATNAVADVVAVLTVKHGEAVKTYNITSADAEVAAKIKDGAAKGATASVKGELSADETVIAATKYEEVTAKAAHAKKHADAAGAK
jgi:hypothetical protein